LRIANTAGYFERGNIFFDESLKDDRFMKRMTTQYLRFRVGLQNIEKDAPDAMEGAIHLLQNMFKYMTTEIAIGQRKTSSKRV